MSALLLASLLGALATAIRPLGAAAASSAVTTSDSTIASSEELVLLGKGNAATFGTTSATLYRGYSSWKITVRFRNMSTGAVSDVAIPDPNVSSSEWTNPSLAMTSASTLWIFTGGGMVEAKQFTLSGSPLPTQATLASSTTFGDSDSGAGAVTALSSGGLVGVWRQQGFSGPQGMGLVYRSPSGHWSTIYPLQFMPTKASTQVIVQHPADGSIWLFADADAWGRIGAAHLTETSTGLSVDWTNDSFISVAANGNNGPDPEDPDLEVAPDPTTGTVALAYESADRKTFSTSPTVVTGSYPVVARVAANRSTSFVSLPVRAERVSQLGFAVRPGQTWLAYRPIDPSTLDHSRLYITAFSGGVWSAASLLGTVDDPWESIGGGLTASTFTAKMSDTALHVYNAQLGSGGTTSTTTSSTTSPSTTSTTVVGHACNAKRCH